MKENKIIQVMKDFWMEEDGIGVVEIILILVILIGLVLIFKKNIESIVNNAMKKINEDSKTVTGD